MTVSNFTKNMMANFPSWMKMAKDESSVGAQFLNVFGLTFEELKKEMDITLENFYIETAHTEMIDILYRIPLTTATVSDMDDYLDIRIEEFDGIERVVMNSANLRDFYALDVVLPKYFIDRHGGYLYLRLDLDAIENLDYPFKSLIINQAKHYNVEIHHVWNFFDEFGLLLGLKRLPRERNDIFKARILDVFENPGNSTNKGLQNGISRELGLPNNAIEIIDFQDRAFNSELVNADGTPTKKMADYAKQLNDQLKFTWDSLNLGEAYWFSLEENNLGVDFLPHVWDVDLSLFKTDEFQSGIGFGDDLKLTLPTEMNSTREFKAYVSLAGYYEKHTEFFPEIAFQYKIYAKGKTLEQEYHEETFKYTVTAAPVFDQTYQLTATQDFDYVFDTGFGNKNDFVATTDRDKIKFAKSNEFLHTQTDSIMQLSIELETSDTFQTNKVSNLGIVWEDTSGLEHTYRFVSENDFLVNRVNAGGNPQTSLAYGDIYYDSTSGQLGLGIGDFQQDIDTTVEWQQGQYETNTVLVANGGITLNLDTMKTLMN